MKSILLLESCIYCGNLALINALHPLKRERAASTLVSFPSESGRILLAKEARPSLTRLMDAVDGWPSILNRTKRLSHLKRECLRAVGNLQRV